MSGLPVRAPASSFKFKLKSRPAPAVRPGHTRRSARAPKRTQPCGADFAAAAAAAAMAADLSAAAASMKLATSDLDANRDDLAPAPPPPPHVPASVGPANRGPGGRTDWRLGVRRVRRRTCVSGVPTQRGARPD